MGMKRASTLENQLWSRRVKNLGWGSVAMTWFFMGFFGAGVGCSITSEKGEDLWGQAREGLGAVLPGGGSAQSRPGLFDPEFDRNLLPEAMNGKVTHWIEYFQDRGREHMTKYLSRSSRYIPEMKEILKAHDLPEDLVYIALIESGFNSKAHSRARAVGYWQFIRGTGRRYGLEQNYYVDERRDFARSTEAAALYLKALYNLFGSWSLAIASYNAGENRIKRLVMKHYTRDFWELTQQNRFPRETREYVPKFLAARLIAKDPQKYGFENINWEPPLDYREVPLKNQGVNLKTLAKHLGLSKTELYDLNPAFKRGIIPKRRKSRFLRLPSHIVEEQWLAALEKSASQVTLSVATGRDRSYRIRYGDTLSHLARRFRTSVRAIQEANNLRASSILYPGKKLIIPSGRRGRVAKGSTKPPLKKGESSYKVKKGDNLYTIAKRFNVSLARIKKRNRLERRSLLSIGRVLVIPAQN